MQRSHFLQLLAGGFSALPYILKTGNKQEVRPGMVIKPNLLEAGATIGLISPGFVLPGPSSYDSVVQTIESLGFNVEEGRNARNQNGYLAGSDEERAADLNEMFANRNVDAIIPFRGGWGSNRLLDMIDFELIRNNPKPIIGFSDITSLLLAIHARTGLITFHGPVGNWEWTDFTTRSFRSTLMEKTTPLVFTPPESENRTLIPGTATGPLLGGNLSVLTSMLGSPYLPDFDGALLFIEDVGENIYRVDRMLTQLKIAGILEKINGFILGQCSDCSATTPSTAESLTLNNLLQDHIEPLDIPSFRGTRIGHIDDMFTLPVGLTGQLDSVSGTITFNEAPVI